MRTTPGITDGICLSHVCAGYPAAGGTVPVLRDISCRIEPGQRVCILGENGCGKTTLLRVLSGLLPCEGELRIDGREVRTLSRREMASRVALLTQFSHVYFAYRVWETVMLGRFLRIGGGYGAPGASDRELVARCLERTGLTELADRPLTELSGGQLQRVFLARAWAQETPYLLLDEPTNHLDLRYQAALAEDLLAWSAGETVTPDGETHRNTLIGVFHDVRLALRLADVLLVLKEGRLLYAGPKEAALAQGVLNEAYGLDVPPFL